MAHIVINGANLWYTILGNGEPIILHHGYTASRVNWMPVAKALSKNYKIILMECRGTGESEDTESGYNLAQYTEDVVGLADHLNLDRFSFGGHSMGGGIGFLLGINYAERLNKLILMAPIPSGGIKKLPSDAYLEERLGAKRNGDRAYFKAELIQGMFRDDVQTDAWFESRVDHLLRVSERHLLDGLTTMYELDVEAEINKIQTPTLMLAGGADSLIRANLKDYMRLPDASLHVFSRAGHDVAIHEPEGVSQVIDQFMAYGAINAYKLAP